MKTAYLQWITLPVSISSYCFVCTQANSGSVYYRTLVLAINLYINRIQLLKRICAVTSKLLVRVISQCLLSAQIQVIRCMAGDVCQNSITHLATIK